MKSKCRAIVGLAGFFCFSWSCYSLREIKPEVLGTAKPGDYEIRKIERTSGEIIEYPETSLGQVGKGQITGTWKTLSAEDVVEVDSAGLEIISPPGLMPQNVRTRDGKTFGWVSKIEDRGDKSILHIVKAGGYGDFASQPVLFSDIRRIWIREHTKSSLGFFGGGTLSFGPPQSSDSFSTQWSAGSHSGYFIRLFSPAGHLSFRLDLLSLKYQESDYVVSFSSDGYPRGMVWESFPEKYFYFGASSEYSFFKKPSQRLVPFMRVGLVWHPYIMLFGAAAPDFPPGLDLKMDAGLEFKMSSLFDLRAQLFYIFNTRILAYSIGLGIVL